MYAVISSYFNDGSKGVKTQVFPYNTKKLTGVEAPNGISSRWWSRPYSRAYYNA
jgi:hypothetical protein